MWIRICDRNPGRNIGIGIFSKAFFSETESVDRIRIGYTLIRIWIPVRIWLQIQGRNISEEKFNFLFIF